MVCVDHLVNHTLTHVLQGGRGPSGEQGVMGKQGMNGVNGRDGIPGMEGEVGSPGLRGRVGSPGSNGQDGKIGHKGIVLRCFLLFYLSICLETLGMAGERGPSGNPGLQGNRGFIGEAGTPGLDGTPGSQGKEGPSGKHGERGRGNSEIFTLHSFNHSVPVCPQHSSLLWDGYSLASLSRGMSSPLSNSFSCARQFSILTTLRSQGPNKDSVSTWYAASDVKSAGNGGGAGEVSRCAVCEMEGSLLTVHSLSTNVPPCPSSWESFWNGFTLVSETGVSLCHLINWRKYLEFFHVSNIHDVIIVT